jgi:hypothetical protein
MLDPIPKTIILAQEFRLFQTPAPLVQWIEERRASSGAHPGPTVVRVVLVAVMAGIVAAVVTVRRVARLNVLAALDYE